MTELAPGLPLSERELEILAAAAAGETRDETGRRLYLTLDTVKTHRWRAFRKLGARSLAHAIAISYERGLLPRRAERTLPVPPDRPGGTPAP